MEAQMHRPHGVHEEQPQYAGLHSGEDHDEKKSVLKKVKAKARKIKDSVKHLGHGHEHGNIHDEDEEEDDEEMEPEAEVHGAPIYDSSFIPGTALPRQDVGLGQITPTKGEDRVPTKATDRDTTKPLGQGQENLSQPGLGLAKPTTMEAHTKAKDRDTIMPLGQGQEHLGQPGVDLAMPTIMEAHAPGYMNVPPVSGLYGSDPDPHRSNVSGQGTLVEQTPGSAALPGLGKEPGSGISSIHERKENLVEPNPRIGVPAGLERDPDAPFEAVHPSNYESKVIDPTGQGGEEARIGPLISSFGKMEVKDESEAKPASMPGSEYEPLTGSHDQFAPTHTESQVTHPISHNPSEASEKRDTIPKSFDASKSDEMPRDTIDGKSPRQGQGSYTEKISSAASATASAITGKAISAKNVVASKLGYGGPQEDKSEAISHESKPVEQQGGGYTDKISYATSAIADKAAAAKNVVASKLGYTGTDQEKPVGAEATTESSKSASPPLSSHPRVTDKTASMKEYIAEKFRPGEDDKALSEVISETLYKQKERTPSESKPPIERVTESEEVKKRLGTGKENQREGEDAIKAGSESSVGGGVMDKITGAVSSWISKGGTGGESKTSQGSPGTTFVEVKGPHEE